MRWVGCGKRESSMARSHRGYQPVMDQVALRQRLSATIKGITAGL